MPAFPSFAAVAREFEKIGKELELVEKSKITKAMAEKAQTIAHAEAVRDLGSDAKFSHWKPPLDTQVKSIPKGATVLMPTRSSAGPWTVANQGRHQGNASGFSGPGISTRTGKTSRTKSGGLRKVRARAGKRWNGTTDPKHTADRAVHRMDAEMPKIAEDGLRVLLQRHFDVT